MIGSLIIGGVLGWLAGIVLGKDVPGGILGNIIAGFLGGWIGNKLFGPFGPVWGDFSVIPTIVGAMIFIVIITTVNKRN